MKSIKDARKEIVDGMINIVKEHFTEIDRIATEEQSELQKAFDDLYLSTAEIIDEDSSETHQKYKHLLKTKPPLKVAPPLNDVVEVTVNGETTLMYSCGCLSDNGYLYCSITKGGNHNPIKEWRSIK